MRRIRGLFIDENLIGVGRQLARLQAAGTVLWVGHPEVPHLPLGTRDEDIFSAIGSGGLNLFFVTRDRKIRTRPAERKRFFESRVRALIVTGANRTQSQTYELILKHWDEVVEIEASTEGPCAFAINSRGVRELRLL